jgi:hypothetical protein
VRAGVGLVVRMTLVDTLCGDLRNFGASRKPPAVFAFVVPRCTSSWPTNGARCDGWVFFLAHKGSEHPDVARTLPLSTVAGMQDDLGTTIEVTRIPRRVVSLVPSLTESLAVTDPSSLVGATDWCTHPDGLDVARVRGTKNPDLEVVAALHPDLVVANAEENREIDVQRLRARGIRVWVTAPSTVPEALDSLRRMFDVLQVTEPTWLQDARVSWARPAPPATRHAVVPIWRRPWMALGRDTFAGDVLARLGVANVLGSHEKRYPHVDLDDLPGHDLVVLPDEPYAFAPDDGPDAFPGVECACVSGRHLTWYGPSLVAAREVLTAQLSAARMGW